MALARNILLFTLLIDDIDGKNHSSIWQVYYHLFLDNKSLKLLTTQSTKLYTLANSMQSWNGSTYGRLLRFCDQSTLHMVKEVWKAYSISDLTAKQRTDYDTRFKAAIQKVVDTKLAILGSGPVITGFRSAAPTGLQSLRDLPKLHDHFWSYGTTDGNKSREQYSNPMFASLETDTFTIHYGTDSILGFTLTTAYAPLTPRSPLRPNLGARSDLHKVTEAARIHFRAWSESFRRHSQHLTIRFFAGDGLAFCHTLQGRRASGDVSSHWYRTNYNLQPLVLDGEDFGPSGTAPLSFDVIDTSNLVDHLGAIDVLTAASPLLKSSISASLYTESLVMKEMTRKELSNDLLCGHFPTVSILLGLIPVEYWTNTTAVSTVDELLFDATTSFVNASKGVGKTQKGQMNCRIAWKGAIPSSGDVIDQNLHFGAEDLACVIHQVYQGMFEHEDMGKALGNLNIMTLQKTSCPNYHRGSFAFLLKFIKTRVNVRWEEMMYILLGRIEKDTTLLMGMHYLQELYLQLHSLEVYSMPPFKLGFKYEHRHQFQGGLGAWKDIPAVVCLTLQIPRAALQVFTDLSPATLGTPIVHGILQSSNIWSSNR